MAHRSGSFDYKTINENIKKILDVRSTLNNTVQVGMPFVKATTTIRGSTDYLNSTDNIGFTLGLHGISEDVLYKDMFSSGDGIDPLIGYTYTPSGAPQRVYARNPETIVYKTAGQILEQNTAIRTYPDQSRFVRIPPPGITSVTVGRNKNGLLAMAQLEISIPSLLQLESLHRTFLIPGVGMILEWGQLFAPYAKNTEFLQKTDLEPELRFPWHNRGELDKMLTRLAKREVGLMEILENYTYKSNGQYMWMFGRVANFSIKSNSDGSFSSTVKIVGPSEDTWAYDVRNTVVPRKDPSSQYFCASGTNSVYSYFANTVTGLNLKSLLDKVLAPDTPADLASWKHHVIHLKQDSQEEGNPQPSTPIPSTDEKTFADHDDAYFMTWRFFVNVVINSDEYGLKAIFKKADISEDVVNAIGLLLPYGNGPNRDSNIGGLETIDDPMESFVGANKYLRSTDISTMIIVNELAAGLAKQNVQYTLQAEDTNLLEPTADSERFLRATLPFEKSVNPNLNPDITIDPNNPDRGFLSTGVWLNHKAVVKSMISSDTILRSITNLLNAMNSATNGYWQLTLDSVEGREGQYPHSYMVVDANWKDSSVNATKNFLKNVHTFNKYIRTKETGELVGSELIDCTIDLSLPKRLFSQIAIMGLLSSDDIQRISTNESDKNSPAPTPPDEASEPFSAKIADPNSSLAEMFGIITLLPKDGNSPDLTILPQTQNTSPFGTCGKGLTQTVAGAGGQGYQVSDVNPLEALSLLPDERKKQFDLSSKEVDSFTCRQCKPCIDAEIAAATRQVSIPSDGTPITQQIISTFPQLRFRDSARGGFVSSKLLEEVNAALAEISAVAEVSSAHRDFTDPMGAPNSRHKSGRAIDIAKIGEGNTPNFAARDEDGKKLIDKLVEVLKTKYRYIPTEREDVIGTPKAIMWQVAGHYDHIHISIAIAPPSQTPVTPTPPPTPFPPTINPFAQPSPSGDPTVAVSSEPRVCTDADYARISGGSNDVTIGRELCRRCKNHNEVVRQITQTTEVSVQNAVRRFPGLRRVFRYLEIFPELMTASITANANRDRANAFGASPGTLSIGGDLILPGINGLRVGELFWIDRVPAFYKVFGAFQIISIEDTIDTNGWKTKLHARFNYLGDIWKETMVKILLPSNS